MAFEAELNIAGRISFGYVLIENRSLVFTSKDKLHQQTFNEYSTLANFGNQKKIFITSTTDPSIKLIISEPKFVEYLSNEMDIRVKSGLVHFLQKNENFTYIICFVGILFIGFMFTLFAKFGSRYLTQFVSFEQEHKIGKKAFNHSFESKVLSLNPKASVLWDSITKKIMSAEHEIDHHVEFYIVKDKTPNAFALPGGIIVVNTGLIEKANSAEEVLGVLAHELGHIKHRDSLKSMIRLYGSKIILGVLFGGSSLAGYTNELANLKNSRNQESRADKYALKVLNSANISSEGFAIFFEKLDSDIKIGESFNWLSTHPLSKNRVANIKEQGNYEHARFEFPWAEFQNSIKN